MLRYREEMVDVVRFGKCLSDPKNIRMLSLLRNGELCLCELESVTRLNYHTLRVRLKQMVSVGLVRARKRSRWTVYELEPKYHSLIDSLFEAFDDDLGWDKTIVHEQDSLSKVLKQRLPDWCMDSHYKNSEPRIRKAREPFGDEIDLTPKQEASIAALLDLLQSNLLESQAKVMA